MSIQEIKDLIEKAETHLEASDMSRLSHSNGCELLNGLRGALLMVPEWRPISTAPKDGTRVLLWSPDATIDNPYIGHWVDREDYPDGGAWWEKDDNDGFCADADPSYWTALPLPPTGGSHG
jgi:hypothetical protein